MAPAREVGLDKLQEIYVESASSRAVLDDFANRSKKQRITKVDQVLSRKNVQRGDVIRLFRQLEKLGHGQFVEGRKGHPSRFVWSSSQIDVARAAKGEDVSISPISEGGEAEEEPSETRLRDYSFPLRAEADAKFTLPSDLTPKEAERLGQFLKTLVIPE